MSLDDSLSLLSNPETLEVANALVEMEDDTVPRRNLREEVLETDEEDSKRRFDIRLHHNILPKMEDNGFVEYDRRSNTVRYRGDERFEELVDHLHPSPDKSLGLMSNPETRRAAYVLTDMEDDSISYQDLAESLQEKGIRKDREDINRMLHHQTIPKMEGLGVLEYDRRSETVRYRGDESFEELVNYVRDMDLRDCTF